MPTTSQIVQRVLMHANDWSVDGERGVLPIINEVNNVMMSGNTDHAIQIDSTTGRYPYLDTTAGTLQYDCPDDCRKVASVMVEASRQYENHNTNFAYSRERVWGIDFYVVSNVMSRLRTLATNATVTFPADPGDTSDYYYLKYWVEPTNIQSINQQVDVPEEFHHLLIDGCVARVQPIQYGRPDPWMAWVERMKMEFWSEMNANYPRNVLRQRRYC